MKNTGEEYGMEQRADLLSVLANKYKGNLTPFCIVWDLKESEVEGWLAEQEPDEGSVPTIEELKADAYRQLKGAIAKTSDPQKLATTLKTLEDMRERDEGKTMEEKTQGVAESIASLADVAPPEGLTDVSLNPVVAEHVKRPRRKKAKPSEEINGLDENSDTP